MSCPCSPGRTGGPSLTFDGLNFLRFLILRSMNSRIHANLEDYWKVSSVGTALAFLHYVGSRYVFWPRAFEFREQILEWLPGRLGPIKLGDLTLARLPEIYMHCSYAIDAEEARHQGGSDEADAQRLSRIWLQGSVSRTGAARCPRARRLWSSARISMSATRSTARIRAPSPPCASGSMSSA